MSMQIKKINAYQQDYYEKSDKGNSLKFISEYSGFLEKIKNKKTLKILDIGGGSGHFSMALSEYFLDKKCSIFVIDKV
jgi:ubiquinone/menaquinone biosynthesis C-methylase UbiE